MKVITAEGVEGRCYSDCGRRLARVVVGYQSYHSSVCRYRGRQVARLTTMKVLMQKRDDPNRVLDQLQIGRAHV